MITVNYGLMVAMLRNTYPWAEGGGKGGLSRDTGINHVQLCRYVNGQMPIPRNRVRIRQVARARLTPTQRRQCGIMVERELDKAPGVTPGNDYPSDIDYSLLVQVLAETYFEDHGLRNDMARVIDITQALLSDYERGRCKPCLSKGIELLNIAMRRLTDFELEQCRESWQLQAVAA